MNRAQRRAKVKATPAHLRITKTEIEKRLLKNGISRADLEQAYNKGRQEGFIAASEPVMQSCYAAVCLALHELYGFGQTRCANVINAMDKHISYSLTSTELVDQVFEELDIRLDFSSAFGVATVAGGERD